VIRLSTEAVNAAADAVGRLADGGWLDIYEGGQPAQSGSAVPDGARLLASLQFGTPAFKPARDGVATAYAVLPDRDAAQTGKPGWFRIYRADHVSALYDGEVTRPDGNGEMHMRALVIAQHGEVSVETCQIRMPQSMAALGSR
jgi:hypothetical protein